MSAAAGLSKGPVQVEMHALLNKAFSPISLQIDNESFKHSVPKNSETHFKVFLVSDKFDGIALLQRHRMVNAAVADLLAGPVHALSISAKTPAQANAGASMQTTPNCKGGAGK
jgi:BolA protein